ncbi:hypothetical protein TTHERM_00160540 (macronuclear) [Tetrahymena thermophila SB210]|uniref:Uncharacterized protein n=1 Tax=Tetrahymena thermophila (strain SB210) TaxID=312017 RepID=Q22W78_TETTS|nr:hypothetical protein TTHERM_00160540 [Tetrahymena thermophila SB210]EAR89539.1 hypothetical protein TTHERM_00160540 [Tetrahymena thermophila SB210]|eukprot:XP_001009784.1 hypothetical protein TTHERM_00160540 [Tetrahymena thermophila SB210]
MEQQLIANLVHDNLISIKDNSCYEQEDEMDSCSIKNSDQYKKPSRKLTIKNLKSQTINGDIEIDNNLFQNYNNKNQDLDKSLQYTLKTNNLIKNILKKFYKFLIDKKNIQLVSEFIIEKPAPYSVKLIKRYFERVNYNNFCLIKIIKHQNYGKGFEYFLTFDAIDELYKSKVKNIQEHIDCISYLKECCANQEQINEINFYRKNKSFQM